jgi:very-short-patch-repair endonuclease
MTSSKPSWFDNLLDGEGARDLLLEMVEASVMGIKDEGNDCESTIEFAMAVALRVVRKAMYPDISISPQAVLRPYRVDFLITHCDTPYSRCKGVVVECDGHDFHEKTKEQAARDKSRDRDLQERGYQVFRYAGSEIWRDPIACARQVLGFVQKTAMLPRSVEIPVRNEVEWLNAYRAFEGTQQ